MEGIFRYKGSELDLKDGFLIAYELLLYKEIRLHCDNQLEEVKIFLLDDLASMLLGMWGSIDFNRFSEVTIQKLIVLTESIIYKVENVSEYLTKSHTDHIRKEAREYFVSVGKLDRVASFDRTDFMYANEQLPIENYLHAFQLIKLLLMGVLKDFDRNGLLVGW